MKYRYSLIVTQYYHSRHMFIVKIKEDFIKKAREFVIELEKYKRSNEGLEGTPKSEYLGGLDPEYCKDETELRRRYNINDAGDIYFINGGYANYCMHEAFGYKEDSRRESAGFKRKVVIEAIKKHHNYGEIVKIVEKYFEIA